MTSIPCSFRAAIELPTGAKTLCRLFDLFRQRCAMISILVHTASATADGAVAGVSAHIRMAVGYGQNLLGMDATMSGT